MNWQDLLPLFKNDWENIKGSTYSKRAESLHPECTLEERRRRGGEGGRKMKKRQGGGRGGEEKEKNPFQTMFI